METVTSFFSYIFDITPGPDFRYTWPMIILSIILIIGAMVFASYYRKRKKLDMAFKKLFGKVSTTMLTFGALILIFTAIRYENIPYFSMRIWFAALLLIFLYVIFVYIKAARVKYPKLKSENAHKQHGKQKQEKVYLASKKKHR